MKKAVLLWIILVICGCASGGFTETDGNDLSVFAPGEQSFLIGTEDDSYLQGKWGTYLIVPPHAFVDSQGHEADGPVTVFLTEIHSSTALAALDINMAYRDGTGEASIFESAGMFRVRAEDADGNELFLGEGKGINVDFYSTKKGDEFFVYKLDRNGQWVLDGHNQELDELLFESLPRSYWGSERDYDSFWDSIETSREYIIDELTWWNFDRARQDMACLKFRLSGIDPEQEPVIVYSIGIDEMFYFDKECQYRNGDELYINTLQGSKTVLIIIAPVSGLYGVSDEIDVPAEYGTMFDPESPENYWHDIGRIEMKDGLEDLLEDQEIFQEQIDVPIFR